MTEKETGNILVVDDTKENLKILANALGNEGYRVRPALSGPVALEAAKTEPPDLILLDIMMPGMDGYQVCRALKRDPLLKDIPVIFISAMDQVADKIKGFQAGGVDYVSKPFQTEEVLSRVGTHLYLRKLQQDMEIKNARLTELNRDLQKALSEIKTLQGIISICSHCKKIRNDNQIWEQVEAYISDHSEAQFSHGICPDCLRKFYPDLILHDA
jgi:DNA-binding response OmpR family regulator